MTINPYLHRHPSPSVAHVQGEEFQFWSLRLRLYYIKNSSVQTVTYKCSASEENICSFCGDAERKVVQILTSLQYATFPNSSTYL